MALLNNGSNSQFIQYSGLAESVLPIAQLLLAGGYRSLDKRNQQLPVLCSKFTAGLNFYAA
ncbi:MAG: hypothetical protein ACLPOA_02960, partial [Methylocella sp.]